MSFSLAPTSSISSFTTSRNHFLFPNNSISITLLLIYMYFWSLFVTCRRRRCLEGRPLQVRHKQDWGRGFILLLPQAAVLPGSDPDSEVVKPLLSFVFQNRQTLYSMWCPMYEACYYRTWSAVCSAALHSQFGDGAIDPICA